jgi:hypothetical protein
MYALPTCMYAEIKFSLWDLSSLRYWSLSVSDMPTYCAGFPSHTYGFGPCEPSDSASRGVPHLAGGNASTRWHDRVRADLGSLLD